MSGTDYPLEGSPTDEQKERLENWLTELLITSRKYGLVMREFDDTVEIIDVRAGSVIGMGLSPVEDGLGHITAFDCADSILDGVWPIDTPDGPQEQRIAGRVWQQRDAQEQA